MAVAEIKNVSHFLISNPSSGMYYAFIKLTKVLSSVETTVNQGTLKNDILICHSHKSRPIKERDTSLVKTASYLASYATISPTGGLARVCRAKSELFKLSPIYG